MLKLGRIAQCATAALTATLILANPAARSAAWAGEQPNLMIVGEDADLETVPRGSRIFNRMMAAITGDMTELGFKVYDETTIAMDITQPGRVRRTDAELISVAQRVPQPPIDVVVAIQMYSSVQQNAYSDLKELRVRISGRMVQVQTGKALGNFEVAIRPRGLKPLPVNCNRDCILEHVGNEAKPIAHEVGIVLARKLAEQSPVKPRTASVVSEPAPVAPPRPGAAAEPGCSGLSTAYTLVAKGFDMEEMKWVEQAMMAFKGYEHHRPVRSQTRFVEYWYETCSDMARLERNLRLMLEQVQGQTRLAFSGNRFELERIPGAGQRVEPAN